MNNTIARLQSLYTDDIETNEAIDTAIKALEDKSKGEWIPVSERLPEKSGEYLVTVDLGNDVAWSSTKYFFANSTGWNYEYITAWMPFPEAYKETENEIN